MGDVDIVHVDVMMYKYLFVFLCNLLFCTSNIAWHDNM